MEGLQGQRASCTVEMGIQNEFLELGQVLPRRHRSLATRRRARHLARPQRAARAAMARMSLAGVLSAVCEQGGHPRTPAEARGGD